MDDVELIELVDRLRALPAETEWLEFKANRFEPQETGEYLSALANSACLANEPRGYLIFGVDDRSHGVTGTSFDPYVEKAKNNQGLIHWLSTGLEPRGRLDVEILQHPDGRVVVLAVDPARGQPVAFYGKAFIRIGSSKTALSRYPAKARALWMRGYDWSAERCSEATLADLDPEALEKA
ncbi:MAG TPA: ATP-binding protein, partial [Candidatus Krumholzibacteria bacterium]|nr:ATP-binding protein [Candidatus Krumholzibacteria bacterium]